MTASSPSIVSESARTGVIPIPPAIRSAFGAPPCRCGEAAERALGDDPRPDRDRPHPRRVVARGLDADPERPPVRRGRERERMRRPPEPTGEEAPEEELARAGSEAVEAAARHPDRRDGRPLRDHLGDSQPEAQRRHDRSEHAEREQRERAEEQDAPVGRGVRVERRVDVAAGRDLVEPGERDRRVGRQVHRVPELVRELAPGDARSTTP